jgi:AcrR family transcriptional regulator
MSVKYRKEGRLSRNDWLANAMEVLSKQGEARLNINPLCKKLGVTKGSFYAHFESQADFVAQLIGYWDEFFTQVVIAEIDKLSGQSAKVRLLALMRLLHKERLANYDIAFRAWAAQNLIVAKGIEKVDRRRFEYIRSLFCEIGFSGAELDVRARMFVIYHSSDQGVRLPPSKIDADEEIKLRFSILTNLS